LNKTLYGTKQAPHEWNNELNGFLVNELELKRCISDTCVYVKTSRSNRLMIMLVFVDDIIIAFDQQDSAEWTEYKSAIAQKYKVRDLGEAEWLLQMKIRRDRQNGIITLDQERYVAKVLEQFNMSQCKAADVPAVKDAKAGEDGNSEQIDDRQYMRLVGSLLYAAITTRLDIAYAVNVLSRHMKDPQIKDWQAGKRVLRYLQGTQNLGLIFTRNNAKEFKIDVYSDADWGGGQGRKSTTGYVVLVNGSVVSWVSKKQATVALSSAEAEYMAVSAAVQEVKWISQLLKELGINVKKPAQLYCDNQAAIAISNNDVHHARTKHIDIRHHYVRDAVKEKEIEIKWIRSSNQLADIFTKPLSRQPFMRLRQSLIGNTESIQSDI
jgi:hypothetical protein